MNYKHHLTSTTQSMMYSDHEMKYAHLVMIQDYYIQLWSNLGCLIHNAEVQRGWCGPQSGMRVAAMFEGPLAAANHDWPLWALPIAACVSLSGWGIFARDPARGRESEWSLGWILQCRTPGPGLPPSDFLACYSAGWTDALLGRKLCISRLL